MDALLDALGVRHKYVRHVSALLIIIGFPFLIVGFALIQVVLENALRINSIGSIAIFSGIWVVWTYWHSILFSRHRLIYLKNSKLPYRHAFISDLIPGLTISFSQMIRPWLNGVDRDLGSMLFTVNTSRPILIMLGMVLCIIGVVLFGFAWNALGAARVGFVEEFIGTNDFTPVRRGPYSHVRHPLFWSGILFSCGIAIIVGTFLAFIMALMNVVYGIIYNRLEDRRLRLVFGDAYGQYANQVSHIIPFAPHPVGSGIKRRKFGFGHQGDTLSIVDSGLANPSKSSSTAS